MPILKNQEISYFKNPDFQIFLLEKLEDLASLGSIPKHQTLAEVEYGLSLLWRARVLQCAQCHWACVPHLTFQAFLGIWIVTPELYLMTTYSWIDSSVAGYFRMCNCSMSQGTGIRNEQKNYNVSPELGENRKPSCCLFLLVLFPPSNYSYHSYQVWNIVN